MAVIAEDKRTRVVALIAVILLAVAVVLLAWNAYAVSEQDAADNSVAASAPAGVSPGEPPSDASVSTDAGTERGAIQGVAGVTASSGSYSAVENALARQGVTDSEHFRPVEGVAADTGGSVFTFTSPLENTQIAGDLYWAGDPLHLVESRVGKDVLATGFTVGFHNVDIGGDVRVLAQKIDFQKAIIQGDADLLGMDICIKRGSAANGFYCGGGSISYEGVSKRFIAYGQSIYFDGIVEGDVTLSAQDIVIGPHARITGLLDIRSGQNLELLDIPGSASIAHIDTNLDQPNTIDQITQLRAAIAPYFQVGTMLFLVVSFVLLGLASLWGFRPKLEEANRLVRRYPLAVIVLGSIAILLMVVTIMLGGVLIFTIPFTIIVGLLLLVSVIYCVPFTGASLALMFRWRIRPAICATLGAGIGAALLFVPYVNMVVLAASMLYFVGYLVNILMFGHDEKHDASFHSRQAEGEAPRGRTGGILPAAAASASVDAAADASTDDEIDAEADAAAVEAGTDVTDATDNADADGNGAGDDAADAADTASADASGETELQEAQSGDRD